MNAEADLDRLRARLDRVEAHARGMKALPQEPGQFAPDWVLSWVQATQTVLAHAQSMQALAAEEPDSLVLRGACNAYAVVIRELAAATPTHRTRGDQGMSTPVASPTADAAHSAVSLSEVAWGALRTRALLDAWPVARTAGLTSAQLDGIVDAALGGVRTLLETWAAAPLTTDEDDHG